jgi:hypothetical protein
MENETVERSLCTKVYAESEIPTILTDIVQDFNGTAKFSDDRTFEI